MDGPTLRMRATLQDFRHQRDSWAVATVLVVEVLEGEPPRGVSPGAEVDAKGDRLGLCAPGQTLELTVRANRHPRFGLQFDVVEQLSEGIAYPRDAARWLERLHGVGPARAWALHRRYGDDLVGVLSGTIEADLTEVEGIGADTAEHIRSSFQELQLSGDLESIQYLDSIGASRWEATQVLAYCAQKLLKPKELIESRPYRLMEKKGLGWAKVDNLAINAGCPKTAPARIQAATQHTLDEIVEQGDTMVLLGKLARITAEKLAFDGESGPGLVVDALPALVTAGAVVQTVDDRERTWVCPSWLLNAERAIYQAAKGRRPTQNAIKPAAGPVPAPKAQGEQVGEEALETPPLPEPAPQAPQPEDTQPDEPGEEEAEGPSEADALSPPPPPLEGSSPVQAAMALLSTDDTYDEEDW